MEASLFHPSFPPPLSQAPKMMRIVNSAQVWPHAFYSKITLSQKLFRRKYNNGDTRGLSLNLPRRRTKVFWGKVITQKSGTGAAFQTMLSCGCPRALEPCAGLQAPSICMWASPVHYKLEHLRFPHSPVSGPS